MSATRAPVTHDTLCRLAVKWLKRPQSRQGPGCQVAISEPRCGWLEGEIPDAIGFQSGTCSEGSTVVEVKVSRSDFLADLAKPHRIIPEQGMGMYRYYMAPAGLIACSELPSKWGLIEVSDRHVLTVRAGHILEQMPTMPPYVRDHARWAHPHNLRREWTVLCRLLMNVGDADALQREVRELRNEVRLLNAANDKLTTKNTNLYGALADAQHVLNRPDIQALLIAAPTPPLRAIPPRRRVKPQGRGAGQGDGAPTAGPTVLQQNSPA